MPFRQEHDENKGHEEVMCSYQQGSNDQQLLHPIFPGRKHLFVVDHDDRQGKGREEKQDRQPLEQPCAINHPQKDMGTWIQPINATDCSWGHAFK
ncbi:MAG TPA: hypothetical protein PKD45_05515, partial [Flavobacteriales bacterium]|nr:hypothetical protein [Flavobacteriales bacterium]